MLIICLPMAKFKRPIEEILRLLPGPHLETKRLPLVIGCLTKPSWDVPASCLLRKPGQELANGRRALVLVVFIGGVTFAEISALRFLSSQEGMAYDVIVGTTKVINGRTLIETFLGKWDQ
ncbi:Sec1/munc18-like proteins superfamily [Perilla frutescens var. frutescens]|nr:Sec1/munc18-like proteins superfamily [Perilla frutescens var. frutescens]